MKRSSRMRTLLALCALASCEGASPKPPATATNPVVASPTPPPGASADSSRAWTPSFASQWLDIALEATGRDADRHGARPTVLSRSLAIPLTAMYDAWAVYDAKANGTLFGGKLRRPPAERTGDNKKKAMSFAMARALIDVYPDDAEYVASELARLGYDFADDSLDPTTPSGIGNLVAKALVDSRHKDGANQLGDEPGGARERYADYTGYQPVNPPDKIVDPDRWQPISFEDGKGGKVTPGYLTPQWHKVKPFALDRSDQFRPPPPPKVASDQLFKEATENLTLNATLDCEKKAIVEFMRDGPHSTGQSGHWLRFAQMVSRRDKNDTDRDVKLYFAVANVAMDAFIAAWDAKRAYDSSRPWTLVHHYYKGKTIRGWAGPGKGVREMKGEQWRPYSPPTFVTPPFPGYVSGHSTVSGACSKVLELFTGSDRFGEIEKRRCGAITEPTSGDEVTLQLPTFSATADMAGISRVYGGYHIQADNLHGLALGRTIASFEWPRIQAYFEGTSPTPMSAPLPHVPPR